MTEAELFDVSTPKRGSSTASKAAESYPYYAGYSERFAREALTLLAPKDGVVLDSWNGAGTTTFVAADLGLKSVGIDLNPVMVVVAKSRLAILDDLRNARKSFEQCLIATGKIVSKLDGFTLGDPLCEWIGPAASQFIRLIVEDILKITKNVKSDLSFIGEKVTCANAEQCFLILVLFKAVKKNAASKSSSNPTWTKSSDSEKIWSSAAEWQELLRYEFSVLEEITIKKISGSSSRGAGLLKSKISCDSAENLPLANNSIDVVLTSPPYCTRIDYAISTLIELAVLGLSGNDVDNFLRRELLGTTSVRNSEVILSQEWGEECCKLLNIIKDHPSSGSKSYYYKNFSQYFSSLYISVVELARVVKLGGVICTVLQGSYYKEHFIDLPKIFSEMATANGFLLTEVASFQVEKHFANINVKSKKYRSSNSMVERVLVLRKI